MTEHVVRHPPRERCGDGGLQERSRVGAHPLERAHDGICPSIHVRIMADGVWNIGSLPRMQGVREFPGRIRSRAGTRGHTYAHAPLAWPRALAFGLVSGGVGVLGHDILTRQPTHVSAVLLAIAFATLVARPLAPLRIGPGLMLGGVAVLQTTIHLACVAAFDGSRAMSADEHMQMAAHVTHLASTGFAPALWMLCAHVGVTLLGAFVLLELEAHAWAVLRDVVRLVLGTPARPRSHRDVHSEHPDLPLAHPCPHRTGSAWLVRGPPTIVASH